MGYRIFGGKIIGIRDITDPPNRTSSVSEREENLSKEIKELEITRRKLNEELQQMKSANNKLSKENELLKRKIFLLLQQANGNHMHNTENSVQNLVPVQRGLTSTPTLTRNTKTTSDSTSTNNKKVKDSKPSLLFLCDSNGKYLHLNKLCPKHSVTYARTPPIKTAADSINETDPNHSPSTILFHTGTNDLETSDAQAVAHEICHLLTKTTQKFQSSKILFSSLLPRQDNLNAKTHEVNALIKENIKLLPNVQMIDHTNLHNTKMIVLHNKKHLNRDSLSIFARNLTRTIYKGILVHHESPSSSNSLS